MADIGVRIPMVPLGRVALPMVGIMGLVEVEPIKGLRPVAVGTKGVRPVIGVICESPGVDIERGANMVRFDPGIMGIPPIPKPQKITQVKKAEQSKYTND